MILKEMEIKDFRSIKQFEIKDWLKTVYGITSETLLTSYYKRLVSGQAMILQDTNNLDHVLWCEF